MTKIILLLGLGLLLIVAEVLIPSAGVLGILASLCVVGAVAWAWSMSVGLGLNVLIAAAVLVPIFLMIAFKLLPHSPLTKKLIAGGFSFADGKGTDARNPELLGSKGEVTSPLRPAGMARLDGRRVDVVSRGELIEVGAPIEVIEVQGNRVVVGRIESASQSQAEEKA